MSEECPKCPAQTVTDPRKVGYQDYYHPQVVNGIDPVEIVRRHHCVPVPRHCYTYSFKDIMCDNSMMPRGRR